MRWRAQIRRCTAWMLTVLALLSLSAWVTNLWVGAGWSNGPRVGGIGTIDLVRGGVIIGRYYSESIAKKIGTHAKPGTWVSAGAFQRPIWVYERTRFPSANAAYEYINIPLWPVVVILSVISAFIWTIEGRSNRRLRADRCTSCGYDRRGLASDDESPCPECGKPPTLPATPTR